MPAEARASLSDLQSQLNAALPPGARVFVEERETKDGPLHCLIFQHGTRRHVVEERQPFTEADIPMIVRAVEKWVAVVSASARYANAWTDDPDEADRAVT